MILCHLTRIIDIKCSPLTFIKVELTLHFESIFLVLSWFDDEWIVWHSALHLRLRLLLENEDFFDELGLPLLLFELPDDLFQGTTSVVSFPWSFLAVTF